MVLYYDWSGGTSGHRNPRGSAALLFFDQRVPRTRRPPPFSPLLDGRARRPRGCSPLAAALLPSRKASSSNDTVFSAGVRDQGRLDFAQVHGRRFQGEGCCIDFFLIGELGSRGRHAWRCASFQQLRRARAAGPPGHTGRKAAGLRPCAASCPWTWPRHAAAALSLACATKKLVFVAAAALLRA